VSDYDTDAELRAAIADLLKRGGLDPGVPAYGVAQKVIFSGYASLTPAQKRLYEAVIVPILSRRPEQQKSPQDDSGSIPIDDLNAENDE
jgi:hypothetical protein